jgi:hypothetical protein
VATLVTRDRERQFSNHVACKKQNKNNDIIACIRHPFATDQAGLQRVAGKSETCGIGIVAATDSDMAGARTVAGSGDHGPVG